MSKEISKTQIDKLGERLKKGNISEDDLRLLDQYRRSFTDAYEIVVGAIRRELALEPTGRPAKSTTSISEKLRRESIRLTQVQDIAGCRLTVADIASQNQVVQSLSSLFEYTTVIDRRQKPSHGYRAVHVIANYGSKLIEIQVRTELQHLWAEISEKYSDVENPAIKYGGGDNATQELLTEASVWVAEVETIEAQLITRLPSQDSLTEEERQQIAAMQNALDSHRQITLDILQIIKGGVEKRKGGEDALSD